MNATDDLFERAARQPEHVVFMRGAADDLRPVTAAQFAGQILALARGLIAAGVQPGDRIVLWSANRFEWVLCGYAIWSAGAVTVPVHETASAEQVARIVEDCAPVGAFVEGGGARPRFDVPVWEMDGPGLDALARTGSVVPDAEAERRRREVTARSPATIVYLSGTTGRPTGCTLSHGNLVAVVRNTALADGVRESVLTEHTHLVMFLPLAHVFARVVQLIAVHNGAVTVHTSDAGDMVAELSAIQPTLLLAVPRMLEKIYNAVRQTAVASGHERLFLAAERAAIGYSQALDLGRPTQTARIRRWVFDRLVYARVRRAVGRRVECAVSAGAPLDPRLAHFFRGAGIAVLEGYGLTETSSAVTLNLPGAQRIGTVGPPLPGVAVRIADDGEVLVRGPGVFEGYRGDERATGEVFDDGWLRTGDLGVLDGRYLVVTGRKKDIIVTSAGRSVSPEFYEDRLRAHWLVGDCVVVGDQRPYVAALITIDPESFEAWKLSQAKPASATVADLRADPQLLAELQTAVDRINRVVSHAEAVRRIRVLPVSLVVGDGQTPAHKVRRGCITAKFAGEIAALYAAD